jgi:hypothetical protein
MKRVHAISVGVVGGRKLKEFTLYSKEMTFTPVPRNLVIGVVYFKYVDSMKMELELLFGLVKILKCGDTEVHAVPRSEVYVTDLVVPVCQNNQHSSVCFI